MALQKFALIQTQEGFELFADDRVVLVHSKKEPALSLGFGDAHIEMNHGNFQIEDDLRELVPLENVEIEANGTSVEFSSGGKQWVVRMRIAVEYGRLSMRFAMENSPERSMIGTRNPALRFRLRLPAEAREHIYGCGEQFSYFDLRGHVFPLWTSEQGVGRNKKTRITHEADINDGGGGDYWWTFFPQPTFVSSSLYWVHLDTSAYAVFDFRREDAHELYCWNLPKNLVIGQSDSMSALLEDMSSYFGRQPELPEWVYGGVILGIQGGTDICANKLQKAAESGVPVAGIWAQDWEGINITSFGQRLRWDWVWNRARYPNLDKTIPLWKAKNIRFLVYANCYVGRGFSLCEEASRNNFLVKNAAGDDYFVDFGEFYAGIVDLTNPTAFAWYARRLSDNILGLGASGWMADFGEYLPTDAVLYDGTPALLAHNRWPVLWARCNAEAIKLAHAENEALFFMRAGFTGSQRFCPMMWAGDQNVDWSNDDGLPSAIRSALALAMSGHGLHHSDIGGYTTLYGMRRTKELFMRWTEFAAFSPLMRTHEGNRPQENWQFDSDVETLKHLRRMTRVHVALKEYLKACVKENSKNGMPVIRPLFLSFPEDQHAYTIDDQYLLGPDLLIAPVIVEGARTRQVHFPGGEWLNFWNGKESWTSPLPGVSEVDAPLGEPAVFIRAQSSWIRVFVAARNAAKS